MKKGIVLVLALLVAICAYVVMRVWNINRLEDAESNAFQVDIIY